MNRFVTNLLDMARLESGILTLNKGWCDALDLVGVALKEVRDTLPEHRVSVNAPEALPLVYADFGLIEQVLINLLENSAKYSPPETPISIIISTPPEEGLRIIVRDSGPSIPEEDRDRIFDKFYRLRSTRHVTGSGWVSPSVRALSKLTVDDMGGAAPGGREQLRHRLALPGGQPDSLPALSEVNHGA